MWFARRGIWPECGTGRTGAASQRALDDAELVALRVGKDEVIGHPVQPVLADYGRARPGQARDRRQHPGPADLLRLAAAAACLPACTSRWIRFLAVLASGTLRNEMPGRRPAGSSM